MTLEHKKEMIKSNIDLIQEKNKPGIRWESPWRY